jgi:hypothetical protein
VGGIHALSEKKVEESPAGAGNMQVIPPAAAEVLQLLSLILADVLQLLFLLQQQRQNFPLLYIPQRCIQLNSLSAAGSDANS